MQIIQFLEDNVYPGWQDDLKQQGFYFTKDKTIRITQKDVKQIKFVDFTEESFWRFCNLGSHSQQYDVNPELTGVLYISTSVKKLYLSDLRIEELDLANNQTLEMLVIDQCYQLRDLKTAQSNLKSLTIQQACPQTIQFSPTLVELSFINIRMLPDADYIGNVQEILSSMDFGQIRYFQVNNCREIRSLDLSKTVLQKFICSYCPLKHLLLPKTLKQLECVSTQLATINIPTSVLSANLQWNRFDTLDLRKNVITKLQCSAKVILLPDRFHSYKPNHPEDHVEIVFRGKVYNYLYMRPQKLPMHEQMAVRNPKPWVNRLVYEDDDVLNQLVIDPCPKLVRNVTRRVVKRFNNTSKVLMMGVKEYKNNVTTGVKTIGQE